MIIPMVITALALGRSFDYKNMKSGSYYIFDQDSVAKNKQTIHNPFTHSHYTLIESSSDTNDLLDIDGSLSLKAKRGQVQVRGFGEYLIQTVDREKTVEMMVSVYHETLTETFPDYTKQRKEWKTRRPRDVGTHYIRSITYGGRLMVSYKMVADSSENMEKIKAYMSGSMSLSGRLDAKVAGNLDKLNKEIGSHYKLSIKAYATTGGNIPSLRDANSVLKLIDEYPTLVGKINGGKGSPLKLDIVPLNTLHPNFKSVARSSAMDNLCDEVINKYDDLNIALAAFKSWAAKKIWTEEQQTEIDKFYAQMFDAHKQMIHSISDLDLTKEDLHQFDEAFEAYGVGKDNIPNRYMRDLIRLQHQIEEIPFEWTPFTSGSTHYIHWGSVNCTAPTPEPVYIGYTATTTEGFGNGGNYICLDSDPNLEESDANNGLVSIINGVTYQDPTFNTGPAFCAFCKLENSTIIMTIPSRTECPDGMKKEYSGFLVMNPVMDSHMICFDGTPDTEALSSGNDDTAMKLVPVWQKCDECDEDEAQKFTPCVVCSR